MIAGIILYGSEVVVVNGSEKLYWIDLAPNRWQIGSIKLLRHLSLWPHVDSEYSFLKF